MPLGENQSGSEPVPRDACGDRGSGACGTVQFAGHSVAQLLEFQGRLRSLDWHAGDPTHHATPFGDFTRLPAGVGAGRMWDRRPGRKEGTVRPPEFRGRGRHLRGRDDGHRGSRDRPIVQDHSDGQGDRHRTRERTGQVHLDKGTAHSGTGRTGQARTSHSVAPRDAQTGSQAHSSSGPTGRKGPE